MIGYIVIEFNVIICQEKYQRYLYHLVKFVKYFENYILIVSVKTIL